VPDASETVKGIIEIANQTESESVDGTVGTLDNVRAITVRGWRRAWDRMLAVPARMLDLLNALGVNPTTVSAAVSVGTMTLDLESKKRKKFVATTAISANFTIAFSNGTGIEEFDLHLPITGTVAITMPSTVRMMKSEKDAARWNDSTRVLTVVGVTATYFKLVFTKCDSVYLLDASDYYL
jgi:hypothetical protein